MTVRQGDWTPDISKIASELINGYRYAETKEDADQAAICVMTTWQNLAQDRGDGFTETHWLALVREMAHRCAGDSCDTQRAKRKSS